LVTVRTARASEEDEILMGLADLVAATDELRRRLASLLGSTPMSLRGTTSLSYGQIMPLNKRIQVIELISEAYKSVADAAGRFRQAEVKALYDEGMTMDEIATVVGVTRQRVSALLRQAARQRRGGKGTSGRPANSAIGVYPGPSRHEAGGTTS
jgi:predicted transcriptional regulator